MEGDAPSIFNDVLGPVMRGPSSSHTAGSYHIGRLVRDLLGAEPADATFAFDPGGSYAPCYRQQGSDLAFAAGLMGWEILDPRFPRALEEAQAAGLRLRFETRPLPKADHPNCVDIALAAREGRSLDVRARSTGGGGVTIDSLAGWPVALGGTSYTLAVETDPAAETQVRTTLAKAGAPKSLQRQAREGRVLLLARGPRPPAAELLARLDALPGVRGIWHAEPVFAPKLGDPLFHSASEIVWEAERRAFSLGRLGLAYEMQLLAQAEDEAMAEMARRLAVMRRAVAQGLEDGRVGMQLLRPSARRVLEYVQRAGAVRGGPHARAAARALAAMHANCSGGVVCAAPTGGSAGVLPGVVETLVEQRGLTDEQAVSALFAAGAVGVGIAARATFAAETAGCQVEIGAASAMAAAAAVDAAGGSARQACDAAAIAFQNAMGSVCDLVQGIVEVPCHTRNAAAAAGALVCADLALGGYVNPVPLDETIDAALAVGRMLPAELRCTARGGLAATPSARSLPRLR
ncbi:MAG: L-serine ammonia-lyase, iron-sulfur-dependent, subunit alpha [Candidatus Brocadiia bacterium]